MKFTTAVRRKVCRAMVAAIALAQLAIASYACPLAIDRVAPAATVSAAASPCDSMAMSGESFHGGSDDAMARSTGPLPADDAALCLEHCRHGQQSSASTPLPVVHAASLTLLYSIVAAPAAPIVAFLATVAEPVAATAAPPPMSILHCCFRI